MRALVRDYGRVHSACILAKLITADSESLFTSGEDRILKQFSVKEQKLTKNYGVAHRYPVCAMEATSDNEWLFTCDNYGYIKQWDIKNLQKCWRKLGKIIYG